jgi:hypothetical protein
MEWKIEIDEDAFKEIEEALDYYFEKNPALADRIGSEISKALRAISSNPFFAIRYGNTRCLPLSSFPYMIHFIVDQNTKNVSIVGCIHTSLDPEKKWK